jgi:hypothetical protein
MIYLTATDHINKHPYKVMVPPSVQIIPEVVLTGKLFAPIYQAFDPNMMQHGMYPIAQLVEFCITDTPFIIQDDYDVLKILHQIDAYMVEVFPLRGNPEVSAFMTRILQCRAKIYVVFRRVLNRRPNWKTLYDHQDNIFGAIAKLYQSSGMTISMPQTMFEELAICPVVRAHPEYFASGGTVPTPTTERTDKIRYGV